MLFALRRLQKLGNTALDSKLTAAYHSLVRLRWVMRTGGASVIAGDPIGELVCSLSLIDLITYEFIKNRLGRLHRDIFTVHEHLGKIDAAIAAASFRKSFTGYSVPDIDFGENKPAFIEISGMIHPMLRNPVPNDLHTNRPLLITGSNASGKSTFLKTTAVCAVMAQSLCTAPASGYRASAFRIFTSMALSDDLMSGDSYYISEIKSIKRVMDAVKNGIPVLCLIDEVLRGTNTVERIAASSEILESLFEKGALCIAATHDIELCTMLGGRYDLYHFEETVDEREMNFDYIIRKGPAMSRNAIRLLKLMGFSERFVEAAEKKATTYLETGMWNRTGPEVTP
jgi:DNA mismatch repair ATPase MutS